MNKLKKIFLMSFLRHKAQKISKELSIRIVPLINIFVASGVSLAGCSPAEPDSVLPDIVKVGTK